MKGKEKGFYLEVGAHDGISISNTIMLETYRNWTGKWGKIDRRTKN